MPPPDSEQLRTFNQFLGQLEDGQLHHDLTEKLRGISEALSNHVINYGGKPSAKLVLTVDFTLDGGVFEIKAQAKETLPKPKRGRTILWATADNAFTRANPRQMDLLAPVRDLEDARVV